MESFNGLGGPPLGLRFFFSKTIVTISSKKNLFGIGGVIYLYIITAGFHRQFSKPTLI
jgi:hypothetical protein